VYGSKEARRDGRGQNLYFPGAFSACAYMGFVCMWETWTKSGVLRTCTMYKCIYIHTHARFAAKETESAALSCMKQSSVRIAFTQYNE
jgi:hypothetical protein